MTLRSRLLWLAPLATTGILAALGCNTSADVGSGPKAPTEERFPTKVEHEACDVGSGEKVDVDGDGKPDIIRVTSAGKEACRVIDLNHDGVPDAFIYYDAAGKERRRESDFDRDGKIDEIEYFADGVVTRKDRETNLDGKLDTWDFYESGKLVRRMRDISGDGKVGQWWTWADPDKPDCAIISTDQDGDGKPDPSTATDTCASNAPPAPSAAPVAVVGSDAGAAAPAVDASAPAPTTDPPAAATGGDPADGGAKDAGKAPKKKDSK